jgi:hypothetical protein
MIPSFHAVFMAVALKAAPGAPAPLHVPPPPPLPPAPAVVVPQPPPPPTLREVQADPDPGADTYRSVKVRSAGESGGARGPRPMPRPEEIPEATAAPSAPAPRGSSGAPWFGTQLDAGVPEGLGLSAVLRPFFMLRLHGGVLTNGGAVGLRGGATVAPWSLLLTPSLTVEGGYLFPGAATGAAASFTRPLPFPDEMIDSLRYRFYSAQLGVEIGAPRRFVFFLRAGLSWVDAELQGARIDLSGDGGKAFLDPGTVLLDLTMPSVKLGFTLYLG